MQKFIVMGDKKKIKLSKKILWKDLNDRFLENQFYEGDIITVRVNRQSGVITWTETIKIDPSADILDMYVNEDDDIYFITKGLCKVLGVDKAPTRKEMLLISEKWKPHRTLVSKLFWAIA